MIRRVMKELLSTTIPELIYNKRINEKGIKLLKFG